MNPVQFSLLIFSLSHLTSSTKKKNVLFMIADDMRPELGPYNGPYAPTPVHPRMYTPNIDALAAQSLLLRQTYVQYPLCVPSRASMLTGRRPETLQVYDLRTYFRNTSNAVTLPQLFKKNGYVSIGTGKVFHISRDVKSWSEPYFEGSKYHEWRATNTVSPIPAEKLRKHALVDQNNTQHAIRQMQQFAAGGSHYGKPFFLAVGFHRPHVNLVFPERFLEYYPKQDIKLANTRTVPENFPNVAWNRQCSMFSAEDIAPARQFNQTIKDEQALAVRRAYYSAISYVDKLAGNLMKELDRLGLSNDTVIVFVSDHGFHLGEHNQWCKRTNFEESLRVPAMIRIPGLTDGGLVSDKLTELVDIYPTVVEAAGLEPVPLCPPHSAPIAVCREGTSLLALVDNPERKDWKQRAFSQIYRDGRDSDLPYELIMGMSMRTIKYRYTEWVPFNRTTNKALWQNMIAAELYNLDHDPEETVNVAGSMDYWDTVSRLRGNLRAGWRALGISQPQRNIIRF